MLFWQIAIETGFIRSASETISSFRVANVRDDVLQLQHASIIDTYDTKINVLLKFFSY